MSYAPFVDDKASPYDFQTIELTTKHSSQAGYEHAPAPNLPIDRDAQYSDSKALLPPGRAPIGNWPVESQQVAALTPLRGTIFAFDIVLASAPLLFIVLALKVARLDGKTPEANNDRLLEMLLFTPTIFPLLFAALMGRFFRHLGLWLAERGTTLGRLEQLLGCQSVFLAIERQICLRNFSIIGICSVLIWLLSPFGGQSALRVLRQEQRYLNATRPLYYLDPMNLENTTMGGASMVNTGRSTFTPLFLAALLSSGDFQTSKQDLWGNVKIPLYRSIENSTLDDWKAIPDSNQTHVRWSSLIGIPVTAFDGEAYTNASMNHFKIRTRQFDINCSNNSLVSGGWGDATNYATRGTWMMEALTQQVDCSSNETPCHTMPCSSYPCPFISRSSALSMENSSSVAYCEFSNDYVEASIECITSACRATALRKLDLYSDGYTEDWEPSLLGVIARNLMNTITSVDTIGVSNAMARGATVMEKWMHDPTDFIGRNMYQNVDLYEVPVDIFAERLTILWNSFFQSTYAARALAGNLDKTKSDNHTLGSGSTGSTWISFNATEALVSQRHDVYRISWTWFGILLSCSLVLLAAAYAGLVLKYLSIAPDIVGYASSLTMLSPYVPTPTGGTTLHGLERTALLHDLPVRLGDVCPNQPVGSIALAANDGRVVGLDRGRLYI